MAMVRPMCHMIRSVPQISRELAVLKLLLKQRARTPTKLRWTTAKIALTYAQFVDRVYGLAERLNTLAEDSAIVASVIPNNVAAPIAITACALTGRILVPIDAAHPPERQRAIFMESGARVLLLAKDKATDLSFVPATIPRLDHRSSFNDQRQTTYVPLRSRVAVIRGFYIWQHRTAQGCCLGQSLRWYRPSPIH